VKLIFTIDRWDRGSVCMRETLKGRQEPRCGNRDREYSY
jgi:hypothetical protein